MAVSTLAALNELAREGMRALEPYISEAIKRRSLYAAKLRAEILRQNAYMPWNHDKVRVIEDRDTGDEN